MISVTTLQHATQSRVPDPGRAADLVLRAMSYFESNREAAWRCLRDASTLLGVAGEEAGVLSPAHHGVIPPGGLAAWQTKRAIAYIEENIGAKLSLEEVANMVGLSKSHFSRAFKRSVGCSPMTYVTVRRVERAKLLMLSSQERLTDVALSCGFADQSHFNRHFRRVIGVSPGNWRRMSQLDPHVRMASRSSSTSVFSGVRGVEQHSP